MRRIPIVLVGLLARCACVMAAGLPADIETAEATAIKQEGQNASYYERSLQPYFYERIMSQCIQQSFDDKSPFLLIIVVDAAGSTVKTYRRPETRVSSCLEHALAKARFPNPPISPFFARFDVTFERQR